MFESTPHASVRIQLYTLCSNFNIIHKYVTVYHTLTSSSVFSGLISSNVVSDLYGLMRHILYLNCVASYCNFTAPLVKHLVVTNGPLYGISYLY